MSMDYVCERGASRNFEAWRSDDHAEVSLEERLDRLEREERDGGDGEGDAMLKLETKAQALKREEKVGDALDSIRIRNAEREQVSRDLLNNVVAVQAKKEEEGKKEEEDEQDRRDAQLARKIFEKKRRLIEDEAENDEITSDANVEHVHWKVVKKQKKSALLPGIRRKLDSQRGSSRT